MGDILLRQDNIMTNSRSSLSLIERRVFFYIIKEIRRQYPRGGEQKTLFDNLLVNINASSLVKSAYKDNPKAITKALKTLRKRGIEIDNGEEGVLKYEALGVGYINYYKWKNGNIEVEISKEILPYYVELSDQYTEYSLLVALALKSKWSQRFYELCSRWKNAGGFFMEVDELRLMFEIENQYSRYAALKSRVIDVAQKELKDLFNKNECDVYFEYSEQSKVRTVTSLRVKVISTHTAINLSLEDLDYNVRTDLNYIFNSKKHPKIRAFIGKVLTVVRGEPDKLKHLYERIEYVKNKYDNEAHAPVLRSIINKDILEIDDV